MLVLASAAFFVMPAREDVMAQSGNMVSFCFNSSTGEFMRPHQATASCPSDSSITQAPRSNMGFCVDRGSGGGYVALSPSMSNGQPKLNQAGTKCLDDNNEEMGNYRSFTSITQTYTPPGTNPGTTPGTNTNTTPGTGINPGTNTNPGTTPGTNTGGTTPTPPTGGCETGFHKVGPLCVPNSPFNNGQAITGEQTLGGLATRIISWLLYFAGVVAVFMAIIGGYQVMTAAGNATQASNGRKTLTNAIIGLVIIILSYVIIQAVIRFVVN